MKRASKSVPPPIAERPALASVTSIRHIAPVPNRVYKDCVDDLRELLRQAEAGEVIGYAIAVMYKGRDYIVNPVGEAFRSPTFAGGMVRALDDKLSDMVHNPL